MKVVSWTIVGGEGVIFWVLLVIRVNLGAHERERSAESRGVGVRDVSTNSELPQSQKTQASLSVHSVRLVRLTRNKEYKACHKCRYK